MLLLQNSSLQLDVKSMKKEIASLTAELEYYKSLLHVCDITKIFNSLAPQSVYRRFFTGTYRAILLRELIARYNFTEVSGPTDRSVVVRIMNKMGKDAAGEGLVTIDGERIKINGG